MKIAVIDTESTWDNRVMSLGVVIADGQDYRATDARYYVLQPEYRAGGMFSDALFPDPRLAPRLCSRQQALAEVKAWLADREVRHLFAYNAGFDKKLLPELRAFAWHDILRLAAYRQTNPAIGADADCCATGRLRRGYGVEPVLQMLSGDTSYRETHNALLDAVDELKILRLLGHGPEKYPQL